MSFKDLTHTHKWAAKGARGDDLMDVSIAQKQAWKQNRTKANDEVIGVRFYIDKAARPVEMHSRQRKNHGGAHRCRRPLAHTTTAIRFPGYSWTTSPCLASTRGLECATPDMVPEVNCLLLRLAFKYIVSSTLRHIRQRPTSAGPMQRTLTDLKKSRRGALEFVRNREGTFYENANFNPDERGLGLVRAPGFAPPGRTSTTRTPTPRRACTTISIRAISSMPRREIRPRC